MSEHTLIITLLTILSDHFITRIFMSLHLDQTFTETFTTFNQSLTEIAHIGKISFGLLLSSFF